MKKRRKAKKIGFLAQHARCFLSAKFIIAVVVLAGLSAGAAAYKIAEGKNAADFYKQAASKYLAEDEKVVNPINIKYQKTFYYYVPIEVNSKLSLEFPGVMLDGQGEPVTDKIILEDLYKYPGLIMEFTQVLKKFDGIAKSKAASVKQYCNLVSRERIRLGEIVFSGNVVGVIYQGTKLAFDAVSMVKNVPAGLAVLAKDLAKGKVQDAIISYFIPADSRDVLESAQKAYDAVDKAATACNGLSDAWSVMHMTSGKVETLKASLAVHNLYSVFNYEAEAIDNLRAALEKVNNYPELVTKISAKDYAKGMAALEVLVEKLEAERDYWREVDISVISNAEMWRDEQLRRVLSESVVEAPEVQEPVAESEVPAPPAQVCGNGIIEGSETCDGSDFGGKTCNTQAGSGFTGNLLCNSCQISADQCVEPPPAPTTSSLNLSESSTVYTYSTQSHPCNSYQNNISSSQVTLKCKSASAHWRAHWVKKVDVSGYSKLRIKTALALNDYTHFFTECGGKGVKYDNYVDLIVLSSDPSSTLSAECNRIVSDADWPKCNIGNTNSSAITHCGVPKCGTSKSCDFEIDVSGRGAVYLVFYATDPWLADIEGTLSNVEITLTK